MGEKPGNCVYIDDLPKYVEAASRLGFKAIQYKGLPQLNTELAKLGIRPKPQPMP